MKFKFNDGGRAAAGFKGHTGDCVARSISIVTGRSYLDVYSELSAGSASERLSKHCNRTGGRTARNGVFTHKKWFKTYMAKLGFTWTPCMQIGSGCKIHLRDGELPMGKIIARVSKHYVAVIDGVINDTFDPQRKERRCVYGYWTFNE